MHRKQIAAFLCLAAATMGCAAPKTLPVGHQQPQATVKEPPIVHYQAINGRLVIVDYPVHIAPVADLGDWRVAMDVWYKDRARWSDFYRRSGCDDAEADYRSAKLVGPPPKATGWNQ